jgi:hypothetical protein
MLSVRKKDPLFINFEPKTAEEAVDRFIRCKNRGLKAYLIPECLIKCAQALDEDECEKFEKWIVNPQGDLPGPGKLVRSDLNERNLEVFEESAKRVEEKLLNVGNFPPTGVGSRRSASERSEQIPINELMMLHCQDDEKVQCCSPPDTPVNLVGSRAPFPVRPAAMELEENLLLGAL